MTQPEQNDAQQPIGRRGIVSPSHPRTPNAPARAAQPASAPLPPPTLPQSQAAKTPKPRRWKDSIPFKVVMVLLVTALVISGVIVWKMRTAPITPKVGDCVVLSGSAETTKALVVKCDDRSKGVPHHVAASVDDAEKCGESEVAYTRMQPNTEEIIEVQCLVPDFEKDKCYSDGDHSTTEIECKATDDVSAFKVVDRYDAADQDTTAKAQDVWKNDVHVGLVTFERPSPGVIYCTKPLAEQ